MHILEELGDQDTRVVLLELRLFVGTRGQIQGPESLLQVPRLLTSYLRLTKKQQQQQSGSTAPEVHVPTGAVRLP